jgi:predicted DNA-binding transcriptional regulator YafY
MAKHEFFLRYSSIIKKLRNSGDATFEEISNYLNSESEFTGYNLSVAKRTFQRDLNEIRSIFNVEIKCNSFNKYYIVNEGEQDINNRMLEALDTFNALKVSERLSKYIHFEKRKSQGTENLNGLLHAIKNSLHIHFLYQKFLDEETEKRTVAPYAIKEFRSRWYVIAKDVKDGKVKSFGLDRLTDFRITRKPFTYPKDYSVEESYKYCFGIISPEAENKSEEIILSFTHFQGKYIKSLPLHETQQVILDTKNELQVKLQMYITLDFIIELLSLGGNVKVLKPKNLINKIKAEHQKAYKQYQ